HGAPRPAARTLARRVALPGVHLCAGGDTGSGRGSAARRPRPAHVCLGVGARHAAPLHHTAVATHSSQLRGTLWKPVSSMARRRPSCSAFEPSSSATPGTAPPMARAVAGTRWIALRKTTASADERRRGTHSALPWTKWTTLG